MESKLNCIELALNRSVWLQMFLHHFTKGFSVY